MHSYGFAIRIMPLVYETGLSNFLGQNFIFHIFPNIYDKY